MKFTLEVVDNSVFIRSEPMLPHMNGFAFSLFREYNEGQPEDIFGFDGPEVYRDMCLKLADLVLNEA